MNDILNGVLKELVEPPSQPQMVAPAPLDLPVLKRRDIYER